MKSKLLFAVLFVLAYLLFVITSAPAQLLSLVTPMPANVSYSGLQGSVWNAQIEHAQVDSVELENISTSLSPLSLLSLSPEVFVEIKGGLSDSPTGQGLVQLSEQQISLQELDLQVPANSIVPFLNVPVPVNAFGGVDVNVSTLVMSGNRCISAEGKVTWQRAAVAAFDQTVELGNFTANISCQQENLMLTLEPQNNLGLTFTAQLNKQGRLIGNGYLKPSARFPKPLNNLLPFLGRKDGQGRYRLTL